MHTISVRWKRLIRLRNSKRNRRLPLIFLTFPGLDCSVEARPRIALLTALGNERGWDFPAVPDTRVNRRLSGESRRSILALIPPLVKCGLGRFPPVGF